jgi:hypothetical protein
MPLVIQVYPYEHLIVSQEEMEKNATNSSRNYHIPSTSFISGGVPPPTQLSSVRTTMVSTTSTSGNGLIPSIMAITAPFTHSAIGPSLSYEMPGFDTNFVLSYSTLQTLGLGVAISNAPRQGPMGELQIPIMISLTKGVIYLLRPLHSTMLNNIPLG